jgi:glycosyltransferase involved in cell wall biosynthesis
LVSVLLPTTGRPDRAESCVRQLRDTASGIEIVCAVDRDPVSAKRLAPLVDKLLVAPFYRGCSAAWNDCLREATGDPVVFAADDLKWGEGWLEEALQALSEHPGHLIGFNDGHWGAELSTHYLMPRDFIAEVLGGVVAWPAYKHSFNDLETCDRAKAAGRYHWCEDARVYHEHWLFGDRAKDETDTRRLPDHPEDQRIYNERKAAGFPDDIPAVV